LSGLRQDEKYKNIGISFHKVGSVPRREAAAQAGRNGYTLGVHFLFLTLELFFAQFSAIWCNLPRKGWSQRCVIYVENLLIFPDLAQLVAEINFGLFQAY